MRPSSANRDGVTVPGTVPPSGQPAAGLSPPGAAGAFPPIKGKRSRPAVTWRPRARHSGPFGPSNSRLFPPSASSPCWSVTPDPSRGGQSPGLRQLFEQPQGAGNPQVRHNISRLCNKSGPEAPLVSAPHIIYIMLTCYVSSTYNRFSDFPPGRGGGRKAARLRDLPGPSPSPGRALCAFSQERQCVASPAPVVVSSAGSGDHNFRYVLREEESAIFVGAKCRHAEPQCFSTVISRIQRPYSAGILPPYAAPLLGRSRP